MAEPTVVTPASDLRLWRAPNGEMHVYLHADFLRRLNSETQRGLKMLPRRGAEIGGILLGKVESKGGAHTVLLEALEPVECSYRFGPLWALTAQEREGLEEKIRQLRAGGTGSVPVGLYRSQTRSAAELGVEDLEAYTKCFPEAYAIFLVAHPLAGGGVKPMIAWRERGGVSITQNGFVAVAAMQNPAPVLESAAPAAAGTVASASARAPAANPWMLALFLVACAALSAAAAVLGVYYYQTLRNAAAERAASPLALQVEQRSGHLTLSWDRRAKPVEMARRGRLSVIDGGYERSVELSANQVRAGRLFYLASSGDVQFRLEIEQPDGRSVAESISFLSVSAPLPAVDLPERPAAGPPANVKSARAAPPEPIYRPRFVLPEEGRPPADPQTIAAPPVIAPAGVPGAILPPQRPVRLNPPRPPAAEVPDTPPAAAKPTAADAEPDHSFAPPQPIREVSPAIAPSLRALLHGPVEIQVQVSIDVRGKVTRAAIAQEKGAMAATLTDAVLAAARQWVFTPARANGHVLPSQKILVFTIPGR
jgi:hypothetical protein